MSPNQSLQRTLGRMDTLPLVSEALMEETWRRVAQSTDEQARRLQAQCGKDQEELTGFVIAYTADLRPDAAGIALYAHVVVAEAFRRCGVKFKRVKPGRIIKFWNESEEFVSGLVPSGRERLHAAAASTVEPAVFEYIVGALTEVTEDSVDLSEDELWHVLRVLKTFMDCMHHAKKRHAA